MIILAAIVQKAMIADGVDIKLMFLFTSASQTPNGIYSLFFHFFFRNSNQFSVGGVITIRGSSYSVDQTIECDQLLVATGRVPNVEVRFFFFC